MKTETRVGLFIVAAIGIFIYLSVNVRVLRLDKENYHKYKAYFDDTSGVAAKSLVRIAGVEVGWVEEIHLLPNGKAEVILMVHRKNKLAQNAFAMIIQEGLIGAKSIEIDPGDPSTGLLLPGSTLSMPGKTPTSVGELLDRFRDIAVGFQEITTSVKNVFATRKGEQNMHLALNSIAVASERLADFSEVMQRTMKNNEARINDLIENFQATSRSLKDGVPAITKDVHDISDSFTKNADKIGGTVDTAGKKITTAFETIDDTAVQARDTFKEASQVMEKINTGKGTVGKLINEDETYSDLKKTIRGLKEYVTKTQRLRLDIDMHSESMLRNSNSKGYFDLKLRPNADCFYTVQLAVDEHGSISREVIDKKRYDKNGNYLTASDLGLTADRQLRFPDRVEKTVRTKNAMLFGLQFGKRFERLALRIGLFENTFGVGADYYVPLKLDSFHWITSLEAFDFSGTNRLDDSRPHVKWLNRVFFLKNLYTTFGVDDIYSKQNANPFWGGGLRFSDDDLKYFLSSLSSSPAKGK
ncbi:MAG: MlaD family protein [bacterium]